jgi:methyl coenzyme M reductase beta subunit
MTELRPLVLLSVQRALLGLVTPDLRAVDVAITGRNVTGRLTYDGEITDEQAQIASEVEGMVIGDVDDDVEVRFVAERVPRQDSVQLMPGAAFCYLRREP